MQYCEWLIIVKSMGVLMVVGHISLWMEGRNLIRNFGIECGRNGLMFMDLQMFGVNHLFMGVSAFAMATGTCMQIRSPFG